MCRSYANTKPFYMTELNGLGFQYLQGIQETISWGHQGTTVLPLSSKLICFVCSRKVDLGPLNSFPDQAALYCFVSRGRWRDTAGGEALGSGFWWACWGAPAAPTASPTQASSPVPRDCRTWQCGQALVLRRVSLALAVIPASSKLAVRCTSCLSAQKPPASPPQEVLYGSQWAAAVSSPARSGTQFLGGGHSLHLLFLDVCPDKPIIN